MEFDKLWNYNEPAATEKKFRDLLPSAHDTDTRLQLLTQIARTLGLQRKFDEAHAILDGVEKEITRELKAVRVRYLLERGRAFNSSKQQDRARPLFLEAWDGARAAKLDDYAVDAAHMMAIVEPPAQKLAWHEKARDWAVKNRPPGGEQQFISRWSIARQLRALGRVDEALAAQRLLLAENDKDGFVHEELGECLLTLGRGAEAAPCFRRAHGILKELPWVAEDKARIERIDRLGG